MNLLYLIPRVLLHKYHMKSVHNKGSSEITFNRDIFILSFFYALKICSQQPERIESFP